MAQFSDDTIQKIKDRLLVSEVMSQYATVVRRGNDFWCNCPIHGEKTPSLIIHDDKGTWHCFGCGKGGTIFNIVQEMEKCTFPEAVRILAKKAGVELEEMTPEQRVANDKKETLYDLYERIAGTFHYLLLKDSKGEHARNYLLERKVKPEMWDRFNLGYAPDEGDFLYGFLKKKSYSDDLLRSSGLFSKDKFPYSLFRNRLMFPVRSWQGKVVAFSGRDLGGESKAKYINTPEIAIYSKKHNLFGLYESLDTLKHTEGGGEAIICEGNFDVVALHQSGLTCAMAPLGTAFTIEQAKLLKRYCGKLTMLFDSDDAGQKATGRALVLAQSAGMDNEVAKLTLGKDASEVVQKWGESSLQKEMEQRKTGFSYLVQNALNHYDINSSNGKFGVFEELKPYLDATTSNIVRSDLMKSLSEVLGVTQTAIQDDYQQGRHEVPKRTVARQEGIPKIRPLVSFSLNIDLRTMLYVVNNRSFYDKVRQKLPIEDLEDSEAKALYRVLEDTKREGEENVSNEYLLQSISDPQLASDVASSFSMEEFTHEPEKNLNEALDRITVRNLEKKLKGLKNLLELADGADDSENVVSILNEYDTLNKQLIDLKESLKTKNVEG